MSAKKAKKKVTVETDSLINFISKAYVILLVSVLPLFVDNGYYNITEAKHGVFMFLSVTLVAFGIVYGVYWLITKRNTLKNISHKSLSLLDISMLCYLLLTVVSAVFSDFQNDVWTGYAARYQGVITILLYTLIYFIISRNYRNTDWFLLASIFAFSVVCLTGVINGFDVDVFGFYQGVSSSDKSRFLSTIGNINFYSAYLCLMFPLVICGFCQTKQTLSRVIYTFALIVGAFGMMVTSSESYMIGFAVSILIIPLFLFTKPEMLKKFFVCSIIIVASSQIFRLITTLAERGGATVNTRLSLLLKIFTNPLVAFVLIAVCGAACFLVSRKPETIPVIRKTYISVLTAALVLLVMAFILANTALRNADIGVFGKFFQLTPEWGTDRGKIWMACIDIFKEYSFKDMLIGVGPEALHRVTTASKVFDDAVLDQAHNEYLHYLMTNGILGLASYFMIIVGVFVSVIKKLKGNTLAVGIFSALISYWIQATVNIAQPFTTPIMYLYISLIGFMTYTSVKNQKAE